jgi:hypothetical protein
MPQRSRQKRLTKLHAHQYLNQVALSFAPNPKSGCGLQDTPWTGDRGDFTYIAILAGGLAEPMHGDPADRLIVATASTLGVPLVIGDKKLRAYRGVKTIW